MTFNMNDNNLSFIVIENSLLNRSNVDCSNNIYQSWLNVWQETYSELSLDSKDLPNEFCRQHSVSGMFLDNKLIGCHLYSFFNLKSISHVSSNYLTRNYPKRFLESLHSSGCEIAMSWEYLTIEKDFRKRQTGIPFAHIMTSLTSRLFKESIADVAIGPTRNSHRVNEICYDLGASCLVSGFKNHNTDTDLIAVFKDNVKTSECKVVCKYSDAFWEKKDDRTQFFDVSKINYKLGDGNEKNRLSPRQTNGNHRVFY